VEARRFDALHRLITGGSTAGSWLAVVVAPYTATQGGELELAELPGLGPILPGTARELAHDATFLELHAVHATTGQLLAVSDRHTSNGSSSAAGATAARADTAGDADRAEAAAPAAPPVAARWTALLRAALHTDPQSHGYTASPRLKRYLQARDRTCTFPGCHRPATATDNDHKIPWPLGPTNRHNMHCLCRHHHRAKQAAFTIRTHPDGTTHWPSRTGWTFPRHPKPY
jgi:hypothetical protein